MPLSLPSVRRAGFALPLALATLASLASGPAARAQAPDIRYAETHTFVVPDRPGAPLTEDVAVEITFLSARSTENTRFSVHEQYFNLVSDFGAELDGRGVRSRQFSTTHAQSADLFMTGGMVRAFSLEERPKPGQKLTYHYKRTYPDAGYLPVLYVPNLDRVERYEIVVRHPTDVRVDFGVATPRGPSGPTPQTTTTDREARVVFADLDEADDVDLFALNGFHAAVQMSLRRGSSAMTPTQPEEMGVWFNRLLAQVDTTITPQMQAVAETLRRDTPRETVAAIHDHVRTGIRYIADERDEGAFVPRAPDIVLGRSYGDCKDRAHLVAALARALGLRVDVVLLAASQPDEPMPAPTAGVSLGLYNHVICAYGDGPSRVYFDPTHPYLPFGDLPEGDVGGRALRFGQGAMEDLRLAAQDSLPALDVSVRFGLDTPETGEALVIVRGGILGSVRAALDRGTGHDAVNTLSSIAGDLLYRIRLSDLTLERDTPAEATYRARADLSQFVVASPTRRYIPRTPFRAVPPEARGRMADELPLDLPSRPNVRLELRVAPGTWTAAPESVAWGSPEAGFEARLAPSDAPDATPGEVALTYVFRQRARHFEGDARTAYLGFADRYLGARREVFTFTPATP